jgi:hypothetical protein
VQNTCIIAFKLPWLHSVLMLPMTNRPRTRSLVTVYSLSKTKLRTNVSVHRQHLNGQLLTKGTIGTTWRQLSTKFSPAFVGMKLNSKYKMQISSIRWPPDCKQQQGSSP